MVQHLQQELQSAKTATGNLHAQYAAQQAHWEGIVKNLQVPLRCPQNISWYSDTSCSPPAGVLSHARNTSQFAN